MKYETPQLEIVAFETEDVIVTSAVDTGPTLGPDELPIVPML